MEGKLYILANILSEDNIDVICQEEKTILSKLRYFAVEHPKSARRLIRKLGISTDFSTCKFYSIHHKEEEGVFQENLKKIVEHLQEGHSVGLLSDAGMAGIADPGAKVISRVQQANLIVSPISGPSAIFLALAASGFNGQQFTFSGYLPIEERNRNKRIQELEKEVLTSGTSQIFMETPYRNQKLFEQLLSQCKPTSLLCVAKNITSPHEFIHTKSIGEWKKNQVDLHKQPTIFILGTFQ